MFSSPFQFGGKLITFENPKLPPVQSPQPVPRQVFVSQVATETEFLQRSRELQAALQSGSFNNYCQGKIQSAKSDAEQDIWKFLLVGVKRVNPSVSAEFMSLKLVCPPHR